MTRDNLDNYDMSHLFQDLSSIMPGIATKDFGNNELQSKQRLANSCITGDAAKALYGARDFHAARSGCAGLPCRSQSPLSADVSEALRRSDGK